METPKISIIDTSELRAGDFAIFHRGGFKHGLPCIAAVRDGSSDLRLVPLSCPWDPEYAFGAMHESAFGGIAARVEDARLEVDFASVVNSSYSHTSTPADALYAAEEKFYLSLQVGQFHNGYVDLKTGVIGRQGLRGSWIAFARWRVVDASDPSVQLFASEAWEAQENDR